MVLLPFDLHVLGTPPALILSQDQTLHCRFYPSLFFSNCVSFLSSIASYTVFKDLIFRLRPNFSLAYLSTLNHFINFHFFCQYLFYLFFVFLVNCFLLINLSLLLSIIYTLLQLVYHLILFLQKQFFANK